MAKLTATEKAMQVREWIETGQARELRERAKLTQALAAQDCEVTQGAVVRWEKGKRMPRGRNVLAYYRFLSRLASVAPTGR